MYLDMGTNSISFARWSSVLCHKGHVLSAKRFPVTKLRRSRKMIFRRTCLHLPVAGNPPTRLPVGTFHRPSHCCHQMKTPRMLGAAIVVLALAGCISNHPPLRGPEIYDASLLLDRESEALTRGETLGSRPCHIADETQNYDYGALGRAICERHSVGTIRTLAADVDSELPDVTKANILMTIGLMEYANGRPDDALHTLEKSIRYSPESWQPRLHRIMILKIIDRPDDAREEEEVLMDMDPNAPLNSFSTVREGGII